MRAPFIVAALPRSRTAWLARFLTYGGVTCLHEPSRAFRSFDDVRRLLWRYDTGIADTGIAMLWLAIDQERPDTRWLVVRRPAAEVAASLERIGLGSPHNPRILAGFERALDHVAGLPLARTVQFAELAREDAAGAAFEHCLSRPFDAAARAHWRALKDTNIQRDPLDMMIDAAANRDGIAALYGAALAG